MDREKTWLFYILIVMIFGSIATAQSEARWILCDAAFPAVMGAPFNLLTDVPQTCINSCSPSPYVFIFASGLSYLCFCTNGPPPSLTSAERLSSFETCDNICPGEVLAPCGTTTANFVGAWYENANRDGVTPTVMVNDCYDETTQTDLDNCREDRRVMALEVGRSDGGTFQEIEFVDPCPTLNGNCANPGATCSFNSSTGFRTCECNDGTEPDLTGDSVPGFVCIDINECTEGLDDCNTTFATCNNLDPGFECLCQVGFVDRSPDPHNDPGRNCVPVFDECYFDTPPVCHHLATCAVNDPPPGHVCTCQAGYTGDGEVDGTGCTNINECVIDPIAACEENAICNDTIGSFTCICQEGFILSAENDCVVPYNFRECDGNEPTALDRRVAYGSDCSVAVLFDCGDTALRTEPNRQRMVTDGFGPYDFCRMHALVRNFSSDLLNNRAEFINNGGINLLEPHVSCDRDVFSIRFSSEPPIAAGYTLDDLFLSGPGDFDMQAGLYKNRSECKGQVWFENGFQYRFETPTTDPRECGTMHTDTGTQIIYSAMVRGRIGTSGPVITRAKFFEVTFLCVTEKTKTVTFEPLLVYDLNRKKRGVRSAKPMEVSGTQQLLTMDLWRDSSFTEVYEPSVPLQASEIVYVKIGFENGLPELGSQAKPLRCWQTLTRDGTGNRFKQIVANGCNENQWKLNGNVRIVSQDDDSFRFGFPVTSFDGGNEYVYVSCLIDTSDSEFTRRCENLFTSETSFHGDEQMNVITVGPLNVVDVCGGRHRGGCDHYCSVTKENTPLCYCATGFRIDPDDPRKCMLPSSPQTAEVYWYYYVSPILVVLLLTLIVAYLVFRSHQNKITQGEYRLKAAEREEIVVD